MKKFSIATQADLEEAALRFGILPFFRNNIPGFSVEEMCAPGMLFGGSDFEGCWEWKGPVIRSRSTAYGKFFRKKAGFVSLELLPYFLKFRHEAFPIVPDSLDEMILDIISISDRITSTDLRAMIKGTPKKRRAFDLPDIEDAQASRRFNDLPIPSEKIKRSFIEAPLQRLQMAGRICISDFRYKQTKKGERYGWGVAEYSTPELLFDLSAADLLPPAADCLEHIKDTLGQRWPQATSAQFDYLLS